MGIEMEFTEKGVVKVSMTRYIEDYSDEFPKDATTPVVSTAAEHLLKINTSGKRLSEERAILFHRIFSKLLFIRKRARPDTHLTIEFLRTSVRDPDEDDWKNLQRLLQYLHRTSEMALHLNSYDLNIVHWWVDTYYGVHDDLKGHTSTTISIGRGCANIMSNKQKINTTRSTLG